MAAAKDRGRVIVGAGMDGTSSLARVTGIVIPHWSRVLAEVRRLTSAIPGSRYIGWDVVVTDEGPCFLEGNNRSGIALLQVHKPLLLDERVRAFFR